MDSVASRVLTRSRTVAATVACLLWMVALLFGDGGLRWHRLAVWSACIRGIVVLGAGTLRRVRELPVVDLDL